MKNKYWKTVIVFVFLAAAGVGSSCTHGNEENGTEVMLEAGEGQRTEGPVREAEGLSAADEPGSLWVRSEGPSSTPPSIQQTEEAFVCCVHICGEVKEPGVYQLPEGSRIFEAIDMAGGFTDKASAHTLNLAQTVSDGMKITVPAHGEEGRIEVIAGVSDSKVDLNQASVEQLMTLKGIGESRARDIVQYRLEHGDFKRIEDIMNVPGIKEAAFQKIKDDIVV